MHDDDISSDGTMDLRWLLLGRPTWVLWLPGMEAALPRAIEREALLKAVEDEIRSRGSADLPRYEVQIGQQMVLVHCNDAGDDIAVWVWTEPAYFADEP